MDDDEFVTRFVEQCEDKISKLKRVVAGRHSVNVMTIAEKNKLFTIKEREKLERARLMQKISGYRNQESFMKSMVKMENVSITAQDVKNQIFVYGPFAEELKGKMRYRPGPLDVTSKAQLMRREVQLSVDVMEVLEFYALM